MSLACRPALLLLVSQSARLAGPTLALLLLAAHWPAEAFGRFAAAYALASLLGLLPATGLSAWLLDRSARQPAAARAMLRRAWRMLSGLALPVLGLAAAVAALAPGYDVRTLVPLTAAMLLAGAVDCAIAALRAQKREGSVAASALPANLALLAAVLLLEGRGAEAIALAWLAVRGVQVALLAAMTARVLPPATAAAPPVEPCWPFFASQSAGVIYGQADTLLVQSIAGDAATGVYAIAVRLLQLAGFAAQTLAQWFQPRLAATAIDGRDWQTQRQRLRLALAAVGGGGALGLALAVPPALPLVLGPAYAAAPTVIMVAGLLLAARCFVAGQWIELTAREREAHRARDSWLLLALFLALALPLTVAYGATGTMLAHLLALGPIAALSGRSLARARQA